MQQTCCWNLLRAGGALDCKPFWLAFFRHLLAYPLLFRYAVDHFPQEVLLKSRHVGSLRLASLGRVALAVQGLHVHACHKQGVGRVLCLHSKCRHLWCCGCAGQVLVSLVLNSGLCKVDASEGYKGGARHQTLATGSGVACGISLGNPAALITQQTLKFESERPQPHVLFVNAMCDSSSHYALFNPHTQLLCNALLLLQQTAHHYLDWSTSLC